MKWLIPLIAAAVVAFAPFVAIATSDSNSTNLGLLLMGDGLHNNDWGQQTNANLNIIDSALSGSVSVTMVSGSTYFMSTTEHNNINYSVNGTLNTNTFLVFGTLNKMVYVRNNVTEAGGKLFLRCASGQTSYLQVDTGLGYVVNCIAGKIQTATTTGVVAGP